MQVTVAYLDNAATTPMRPEAVDAMMPFLRDRFANPSGGHVLARDARNAIDEARDVIAGVLGAEPGDVVFTSGGTEADNLAILGVLDRVGGAAACSAIEHHAVLDAVVSRGGRVVAVDEHGMIDLGELASALDPDVAIVSVMLANNEVGVLARLGEVARVVHEHAPEAVLHTDAVQAFSWIDVAKAARGADLVSVSAHKFGGPKGVGALVVRDGVGLAPRQIGGGQERGRRGGTHNVAGIVAMATAASITADERTESVRRVTELRDVLAEGLLAAIPDAIETGMPRNSEGPDRSGRVAGICHLCIAGVESEALLMLLERSGVYASAGASCSSGAMEPSHVLEAMGVPRELALGSIRLSLGYATTHEEVDLALDVIPGAVERLRRTSDRSRS